MDAKELFEKAKEAGNRAAHDCKPVPMTVEDSNSGKQWHVPGGVCGFAWILIKCNNGPSRRFINQLKKAGIVTNNISNFGHGFAEIKPHYNGGFNWWCPLATQSMETKEAYMDAAAKVLKEAGITVYSQSRID